MEACYFAKNDYQQGVPASGKWNRIVCGRTFQGGYKMQQAAGSTCRQWSAAGAAVNIVEAPPGRETADKRFQGRGGPCRP